MTETIAGRRRLGRGLEALLGPTREQAEREGSLVELAIADIRPNPYQPRRDVGLADGRLELLERRGVDVAARLVGGGAGGGDRQLAQTALAPGLLAGGPGAGFRAAAERTA